MAKQLLLGVDLGTSGTKCLLMDGDGKIVGQASEEYPLHTPKPGWSEQDPEDWWRATRNTCRAALEQAGATGADVAAVGYSGQMHGSVFLDEAGKVIRPCLLWNDGRTWRECEEINKRVGEKQLHEWVSNPALTGFTAPKVLWLRNNEPENYAKVRHLLLPKDYLRYKMTGEIASEVSDAAGTLLYNVMERRWSDELLEALEIPREWMPPVTESCEVSGRLTAEAAEACGLAEGTPVVGGGADNACGAVGAGVVSEGRVMVSLGTSGTVLSPSDRPRVDEEGRLHAFCAAVPGQWYQMGVVLSAGMCLRWFRDKYVPREMFEKAEAKGVDIYQLLMEEWVAPLPEGAEGLYFLPYIMGERCPISDPHARGAFVGLSFRHEPAHMFRAIVEGVSFAMRDNLEVIRASGVNVEEVRLIGGGASSPQWRQIMADVLGCEVVVPVDSGGPGLGAAILAGHGAGLWQDMQELTDRIVPVSERVQPRPESVARYNNIYGLFHALYPSLRRHFQLSHTLLDND